MKKIIFLLTIIIAILTSCCDNVYVNGDLDGMWQLQSVEDRENQTTCYPKDIYYSFQRNLTFISRMNETDTPVRYIGNLYYNEEEKEIHINGLRKFPHEETVATKEMLQQFYIFETDVRFTIHSLNKKQLTMDYSKYRYTLRKW